MHIAEIGNGIALVRVVQHASRRDRAAAAGYLKSSSQTGSAPIFAKNSSSSSSSPLRELHDAAMLLDRISQRISCVSAPGKPSNLAVAFVRGSALALYKGQTIKPKSLRLAHSLPITMNEMTRCFQKESRAFCIVDWSAETGRENAIHLYSKIPPIQHSINCSAKDQLKSINSQSRDF